MIFKFVCAVFVHLHAADAMHALVCVSFRKYASGSFMGKEGLVNV